MTDRDADVAVSRMHDRLPATLYEVAWQYTLFEWYSTQQSPDLDFDLAPEYLAYLTPNAKSNLFGERDSLLIAYVDLSDPVYPKLRSDAEGGPVELATYTEADRFRVGHSYPNKKRGLMTDYSLTTHKGGKDARYLAGVSGSGTNTLRDRFTSWPVSEAADQVRAEANGADRAILDGLATLGQDDEVMDQLSDAFLDLVASEDEELEVLITVRVKLPGEEEWKFPGEVPVLNEVMRVRKQAKLENINVDDASGQGVGLVSDEPGRVTGGSPGVFSMYGKQQREHFPDLDTTGSSAWRIHPLRFDTAAAVSLADSLFDNFHRGLGYNRRLFLLPYLAVRRSELDPETFEWFHDRVYTRLRDAEGGSDGSFDETVSGFFGDADPVRSGGQASITDFLSEHDVGFGEESADYWDSVRFAVVHRISGNPARVFFDTIDGVSPALQLENAHNDVTGSAVFAADGIFNENPDPDKSPLLGRSLNLVRYILYGGYFRRTTEPTRNSREANEPPGAGDIDDSRMERVRNLLTGTPIDASRLLEHYIHQLVQDQHKMFGDGNGYDLFRRNVVEQYAQIHALAAVGGLDTSNTIAFGYTEMPTEFETREERLDEFIESHEALSGASEQAIFTLGALVGRITAYQSRKNITSTLVRRYPVDYITKQTVKEVTKGTLQMDNTYAEADGNRSYWTNARYTDRLADTMLAEDPQSWRLTEAEIQWLYSLGIAYGLSDSSLYDEDDDAVDDAPAARFQPLFRR
ncbi:TM1802 family CRISPR-associated protein [Halorubrum vacuolatum]|uniref:CRISPR-associated protein Cas8b/Csh1, subtype I-B/HMARI n=1 Tax=Halorubrum vacuolatum TaxID=63740 RepID=A0A238XQ78_HALVU|nr:TM1802 family CRISPR-associated protein [Halorubrum vacuolatum]SNR61125.1 CRISPR-associated protein Cas8b/Csh1, subtype I-B/HMARI [Halorubrum vacuolatum]